MRLFGPHRAQGETTARKLISSGSGQRLMYHVLDNPDQMRSTVALQFAVDDDVDTFCVASSHETRLKLTDELVIR